MCLGGWEGWVRLAGCPRACLVSVAACLVSAAVLRKQNTPLAAVHGSARCIFPRLLPRGATAAVQQMATALRKAHATAQHRAPRLPHCPHTSHPQEFQLPYFADLKQGLSTTLLPQVPMAKIGICAIYRAPGQPLLSTAMHRLCLSSSPPVVTHLHAQSQCNSRSTLNVCDSLLFWESQPSCSALLKWAHLAPGDRAEGAESPCPRVRHSRHQES